jgi:hypothetical protein
MLTPNGPAGGLRTCRLDVHHVAEKAWKVREIAIKAEYFGHMTFDLDASFDLIFVLW